MENKKTQMHELATIELPKVLEAGINLNQTAGDLLFHFEFQHNAWLQNIRNAARETVDGIRNVLDFLMIEGDETDQLAKRAIRVMLATDLPQTGYDVDTDPFVANMFASSALSTISDHIKHYPFVVEPRALGWNESGSMSGYSSDAEVIAAAQRLVESAEEMLPAPKPILEMDFSAIGSLGGTNVAPAIEAVLRSIEAEQGASPYDRFVFIIIDEDAPSAS